MDDKEIIALFFQRNENAITETDRKYGKCCRSVSYIILSSAEDSEECVNDAYLDLWNSIPPTRPMNFALYLISIVRRKSLMVLRKRYAGKRGKGEYALCLDELDECLAAPGTPENAVEAKELADCINHFLSKLSETDRRIFMCRYWLTTPISEIAGKTGFSESKVKSSLFRTRTKLKNYLEKEGLI